MAAGKVRRRVVAAAAVCVVAIGTLAVPAGASAEGGAYQQDDGLGFHDILPPGTNGLDNALSLAQFETGGTRPAHNDDQLAMYRDLLFAAPHMPAADLGKYYKDSSFGVAPGNVERTYSPRADVTIVRDKSFGVPHVYGTTRAGVMFGAGYVAGEDRLFFIDVLRNAGKAQLSSFAGGSNVAMDRSQLADAPYSDAELQAQFDALPAEYGVEGQQVHDDGENFVAGLNQYVTDAKLDLTGQKMPAEYAAIGRPQGPGPFTPADLIAEASLIGAALGNGGGDQLSWGQILQSFQARFGAGAGSVLWRDWREPNDPEAPTTVQRGSFPFGLTPKHPDPNSLALPDANSLTRPSEVTAASGSGGPVGPAAARRRGGTLGGLLAFPGDMSNALLVSGAHTTSGHPVAVMGPQVGYWSPEILMEEDLHGPGIDARGAAFPGVNFYVELGRGRDYAWSATSAGQAITDNFAVPLCNLDGSPPTKDSSGYLFRGQCVPMDSVSRTNSWVPNPGDMTAPGSETITVQRTRYGSVIGRATAGGKPVAYTRLRTTYNHEVDSALGFLELNDPGRIRAPEDFQRAAYKIGYTFNWFYVDSRHVAYLNSGANPVRDARVDPLLPAWAQYEWRGFDPSRNTTDYTPIDQHPQVLDQSFITSWNNKQALDFGAADGFYGPVYRSQPLDDRIRASIAGGRRMSLADLVNDMEDAGTVDLRADKDLPWVLKVIDTAPVTDPRLADAVGKLKAWVADGSHRRAPTPSAPYDHSDAITILDAWWPLMVQGEFQPALGESLYKQLRDQFDIDNPPNNGGAHLGSAYDNGWYSYVQKDLRDLLAPAGAAKGKAKPRCRRVRRAVRRHGRALRRHGRVVRRTVRVCPKKKRKKKTARRPRPRGRSKHRSSAAQDAKRHPRAKRKRRKPKRPARRPAARPAVLQPYHRVYCGGGKVAACRAMLLSTLAHALDVDRAKLYADQQCASAGMGGDQKCFDDLGFRAIGAITQPLTPWINRPTYQQALEIQNQVAR